MTPNRLALPMLGLAFFVAFSDGILGGTPATFAQQPGDRVVVTTTFETKIREKKVGWVFEGGIHTLLAVKGNWCSVTDTKGWLPINNIMPLKDAQIFFDRRIQANPRDANAFAHRGMIHLEYNRHNEAMKDLNMSYELNPQNLLTLNNMSKVLNGQGRYPEAATLLENILKRNKNFPLALYNLGLTYYAMGQNDKAIENFDAAIALKADNAWYFLSRGSSHLNNNTPEKALLDYDEALKLNPRMADAFVGKSNVYLKKNDFVNALKFAELAVQSQPKNAMALNARGWALYQNDQLDKAISDFNQAVRFAPQMPVSFNNRGVVYAAKKDYAQAIKDYSQAILYSRAAPVTYANRGTAEIGLGDYPAAKADLEKAVEIAPKLPEANNALAWFLATCPDEKFRDGKAAVEKATVLNEFTKDNNWSYLDTLGAAHAENGDFEKAIEAAKKAIDVAPDSDKPACQSHLELYQNEQPVRSQTGKSNNRAR